MSKLTDIKNRIDQMDGGAFQNLCDAYLSYKGSVPKKFVSCLNPGTANFLIPYHCNEVLQPHQ